MIETALAQAIPTLLGFLASLLGIGGIPTKIQKIFTKLKEPINKVVTTIFEKGKSFFKGIGTSAKKGFNKAKKAVKGAFKGGKKSNKIKPKVKQNNQGKKTNKPAGKTRRNQAKKIDKPAGRTQQNQGKKQDKGADKTQQNQDKKKDEKAGKKNKDKAQNQFELDDITTLFGDADSQEESTENEEDKEEAMSTDTSERDDTEEEPAIQRSQQQNQNPMENTSGFNFSNVRIHTDKEGDRLSRSLETPALTTGSSIFFRQGVHPSKSLSDRKLFTQVIQQSGESPPVASSSPLLSRTVQRVSEDAPYFVRRQAEGNSDTVEISVMTDRKK